MSLYQKSWSSTCDTFHKDRFSRLAEKNKRMIRLWGRSSVVPPQSPASLPAFWGLTSYASLPLGEQPCVLNIPASPSAYLWAHKDLPDFYSIWFYSFNPQSIQTYLIPFSKIIYTITFSVFYRNDIILCPAP